MKELREYPCRGVQSVSRRTFATRPLRQSGSRRAVACGLDGVWTGWRGRLWGWGRLDGPKGVGAALGPSGAIPCGLPVRLPRPVALSVPLPGSPARCGATPRGLRGADA